MFANCMIYIILELYISDIWTLLGHLWSQNTLNCDVDTAALKRYVVISVIQINVN